MRLFVAADHRVYREALALALAHETGLDVVGMSSCDGRAVEEIASASPDLLLVDTTSPRALWLVQDVGAQPDPPAVLALAVPETESAVIACVEAGVSAFAVADDSFADLVAALGRVERGETVISARVASTLIRRVRAAADPLASPDGTSLTARETEILRLIDRGLSNKEIAQRLSIEVSTVKNHVHHILAKLEVGRRTEAAAKARAVRAGAGAARN
jgi:two-component system, NarL family, nitrate/nitrite response regulator NarL